MLMKQMREVKVREKEAGHLALSLMKTFHPSILYSRTGAILLPHWIIKYLLSLQSDWWVEPHSSTVISYLEDGLLELTMSQVEQSEIYNSLYTRLDQSEHWKFKSKKPGGQKLRKKSASQEARRSSQPRQNGLGKISKILVQNQSIWVIYWYIWPCLVQ